MRGILAAIGIMVLSGAALAQESQPTSAPARDAVRATIAPQLLPRFNAAWVAEVNKTSLTNAQKWSLVEKLVAFEEAAYSRDVGFLQAWADATTGIKASLKAAAKAVLIELKAAADAQAAALQKAADDALGDN